MLLLSGMNQHMLEAAEGLANALRLRLVGALPKPIALPDLRAALDAARS